MHLRLCQEYKIALVPDILADMLTDTDLMQADSIHPAEEGCKLIAKRIAAVINDTKLIASP